MTATELAERIRRNAWNWSILDFAEAIGKDRTAQKDAYVIEKWKAFRALAESLDLLGGDLIEKVSV